MNKDKGSSTSIRIETERPFYHPGDTVSGYINLNFEGSDFPGNHLLFKIKGKEETSWEEPNPQIPGKRDGRRGLIIFYNHKFPMNTWKEGHVPAGQYSFPFSFALQNFLPGSYSHRLDDIIDRKSNTSAIIKYMLKAECLALDGNKEMSKIKYSKELIVREKPKVNVVAKEELLLPLSTMCCVPQGNCRIKAYFDKNYYESGDQAIVFCEIDNSNGSQALESLSFELKNRILLRSDEGVNKELSKTIYSTQTRGLGANQRAEGPNKKEVHINLTAKEKDEELKLNEEDEAIQLQESTNGQLINSSYVLEITAKGSGFLCKNCEVKSSIPIAIYKKAKEERKKEGSWMPKVMEVKFIVISEANFYRKGIKNNK